MVACAIIKSEEIGDRCLRPGIAIVAIDPIIKFVYVCYGSFHISRDIITIQCQATNYPDRMKSCCPSGLRHWRSLLKTPSALARHPPPSADHQRRRLSRRLSQSTTGHPPRSCISIRRKHSSRLRRSTYYSRCRSVPCLHSRPAGGRLWRQWVPKDPALPSFLGGHWLRFHCT